MVYECPQCKTPLPPGASSCAKCGLQFATPIPSDATLPAAGGGDGMSDMTTGYGGSDAGSSPPKWVLAAVAALGIILVAVALFAVYTFTRPAATAGAVDADGGSSASTHLPAPPSAGPPPGFHPASVPSGPSASNAAPVVLSGGTSAHSGAPAAETGDAALQGRWQAKNMDFYLFNADGTGMRGNVSSAGKNETFSWVVTANQLVINAKKEERLTFSTGPDATTLYLRGPNGHYSQYRHVGAG